MTAPGNTVLVAVSGGPDSVCLLRVLHRLSASLGINLHVAHLDHMFRGKESADEALFVAELARQLGLPSTIEKIDVPAFCRVRGLPAQAGAREVRYGFLSRAAAEVKASRIATGHTATDQAETFLMRLLRGAGLSGLSGIRPIRENIIRPLIDTTREEVVKYLQQRGQRYMTDPSNEKPLYTRNRIRRDILPVLRQFNPRIVETLAEEAALLRDENETIDQLLSPVSTKVITGEDDCVVLDRGIFNALSPAFKRRLLRQSINMLGLEFRGLSFIQVEEALGFIAQAQTGRTMKLPGGIFLERDYEKIVVGVISGESGFSHVLALPGATLIPDLDIVIETVISEVPINPAIMNPPAPAGGGSTETGDENYFWQALFDYDKIKNPLIIRTRLPGDRFCPSGMNGKSKKLQDYFVDEKIARRKRNAVPLLVAGQDILWAMGLRTDERFLPDPQTKSMLIVRVRKQSETNNPQ